MIYFLYIIYINVIHIYNIYIIYIFINNEPSRLSIQRLCGNLCIFLSTRTSCAQEHELPQSHCADNQEGTLFSWLHLFCTHLASVRFKCSVCCGSLMTTYIYFKYIFIYIFILHILISRPFEITILLFFTLPLESYCPKVFEFSLVTNIIILTSVSYDYATFFNNDCKKARDAGLSCRCHLSNIMPDSILHECMG